MNQAYLVAIVVRQGEGPAEAIMTAGLEGPTGIVEIKVHKNGGLRMVHEVNMLVWRARQRRPADGRPYLEALLALCPEDQTSFYGAPTAVVLAWPDSELGLGIAL